MRRRLGGFTLLEMLVAIAIFSLVAVMAHTGLRSVLYQRQHVESQSERMQQLQGALMIIGRDVGQILERGIRDEYGDSQPALHSARFGQTLLEFSRGGWRNPAGQPRSELQRIAYGVQDGTLYRWAWRVMDRAQDSEPMRGVLLERVEALQLRYLDAAREWHEQWPPQNVTVAGPSGLPLAVEWQLEVEDIGTIRRVFVLADGVQGVSAQAPLSPAGANEEAGGTGSGGTP